MCNSKFHDFLAALPKCEHHVHVEGTLTPELLFALAAKNNIALPVDDASFTDPAALSARYQNFTSLDDFLHYYYIGFSVLLTSEDFEALMYEYLAKAYGQGVRHTEVFFDQQEHSSRRVTYETVIAGFNAARSRAAVEFPDMSFLFIPCLLRHLPVPSAHDMVAEIAATNHFQDGTLAGFGMSGSEKDFAPSMFTSVYDAARGAGARAFTAHAGEEGPADFVASAMSDLGASRIDHGRRAIEDPELMTKLVKEQTMLTLCPLSNVVLKGVAKMEDMPIRHFLDAGVRFSLNSDDPAYFGGYILENYCAVQDAFALTVLEWRAVAIASIDGSWCEEERKKELWSKVDNVVEQWSRSTG